MSSPEIRTATSVDEGALRRFYARAFPQRASFLSEHWRWLYRVGRFPGIEPLVLVSDGNVVGHAGVIPLLLERLGHASPAIWFVDFFILSEFQGRGWGRALTERWMNMCPDRITFCNDRSIKVFRAFGWRESGEARVCSLPISLPGAFRPLAPVSRSILKFLIGDAQRLNIEPLSDNPTGLSQSMKTTAGPAARIVRDEDWVRWRLLEHPRRREHVRAEVDGIGAVLRLLTSLGRRRAHLLHLGHGPRDARARMIASFSRWAVEQECETAWMATDDAQLLELRSIGHLPRRRPLRFAWHSRDPRVMSALALGLSTQAIDSDHDLMFPC